MAKLIWAFLVCFVLYAQAKKCPKGGDCPNTNDTCCPLKSGGEGCCPLPNAVCCSDELHCCPHGYSCDVKQGTCNKKGVESIPMIAKVEPPKQDLMMPLLPQVPSHKSLSNVICPDGRSECPNKNTCCKLASGEYGCCPLPKAVCCSDHLHCCPHGYTCDVSKGTCNKQDLALPFFTKIEAHKIVGNVICPDGRSECPNKNTCCKLPSGEYGCCPLPEAVCCSDHLHCCPHGYTCDVSKGTCNKQNIMIPFFPKKPALNKPGNVICPDGRSECPNKNTCCKLTSGEYGCCPLPKAVCCSDHLHCCPHGYTCDVSKGTCNKQDLMIPFIAKKPALKKPGNVICPDGRSECPNKNTCCKLASGDYGCCPLPEAVCCSDHLHCCPHGYTCDVSKGTCNKQDLSMPFLIKKASKKIVGNVICPDGRSECPNKNTCCKLSSGEYGCCPLPKAVCCSDHLHCCPHGYTCDVSKGTCNKQGSPILPMLAKVEAKSIQSIKTGIVCPDSTTCADDETCCKVLGGRYGCCEMSNAVCCADQIHCCPNGFQCTKSGSCVKPTFHPILQLLNANN